MNNNSKSTTVALDSNVEKITIIIADARMTLSENMASGTLEMHGVTVNANLHNQSFTVSGTKEWVNCIDETELIVDATPPEDGAEFLMEMLKKANKAITLNPNTYKKREYTPPNDD